MGREKFNRAEYARFMNQQYDALDRLLVANRFPPTSPWWRAQVRAYFEHPGRQFVARVGRRGGKSSTICRIAVLEALYGKHVIPPGDTGIVAIISVERRDAADRLKTLKAILEAMGAKYHPAGDTIELVDRPIAFRVFTASIAGVSGFASICVICDEVSKWSDRVSGTNPAKEVITSARATMLTQPLSKILLISSPFGTQDAHAEAFAQGTNEFQYVAPPAPSWVANPTVTEEESHSLEPDPIKWKREYAAIPQASSIAALDEEAIRRIVRPLSPYAKSLGTGLLVFDSSSGRGDAWTWAACEYVLEADAACEYMTRDIYDAKGNLTIRDAIVYDDATGKPIPNPAWSEPKPRLVLHAISALEGQFGRTKTFAESVGDMCATARANGMSVLAGDQYNEYAIASECTKHECRLLARAWTVQNKTNAAATLRRLMREGGILIEPTAEGEKMKKELLALEENILPSGAVQIATKRNAAGHGDRASLALMAALLESEGAIQGSPIAETSGFRQWDPYGG